jgi:hypothetical protein
LIAATVCDETGKTLYTADEVDAWALDDNGGSRIVAYTQAINKAVAPSAGQVAGN